ncbi:hypothetical protein BDW72DRAFT_58077 [Aspergillus terricola var. indicus]
MAENIEDCRRSCNANGIQESSKIIRMRAVPSLLLLRTRSSGGMLITFCAAFISYFRSVYAERMEITLVDTRKTEKLCRRAVEQLCQPSIREAIDTSIPGSCLPRSREST